MPTFTIQNPGGTTTDPLGPLRFISAIMGVRRQIEAQQERQASLRLGPQGVLSQVGAMRSQFTTIQAEHDEAAGHIDDDQTVGGLDLSPQLARLGEVENLISARTLAGIEPDSPEIAARLAQAQSMVKEIHSGLLETVSAHGASDRLHETSIRKNLSEVRTPKQMAKSRDEDITSLVTGLSAFGEATTKSDILQILGGVHEGQSQGEILQSFPEELHPLVMDIYAADAEIFADPKASRLSLFGETTAPPPTISHRVGEDEGDFATGLRTQASLQVQGNFDADPAIQGLLNSDDPVAFADSLGPDVGERLLGLPLNDDTRLQIPNPEGGTDSVTAMDLWQELRTAFDEDGVTRALGRMMAFAQIIEFKANFLDSFGKGSATPGELQRFRDVARDVERTVGPSFPSFGG